MLRILLADIVGRKRLGRRPVFHAAEAGESDLLLQGLLTTRCFPTMRGELLKWCAHNGYSGLLGCLVFHKQSLLAI